MRILSTLTLLFLTAVPQAPTCPAIEGVASLLQPGAVLLLGELHGTVESPRFTRDLACHAATAGLDVAVGLELSAELSDTVEIFMGSEATPADREVLVSGDP